MSVTSEVRERPKRIQLQRRKGWRKPKGAVVVSRPSKWGNPFKVSPRYDREEAVALFRRHMTEHPTLIEDARRELRGKDLCCWCGPGPCHADVLLEIANSTVSPPRAGEVGRRG